MKSTSLVFVLSAVGAIAVGCAGCADDSTIDPPPDPPPPAPEACSIVATTPSFGESKVDAHTSIAITFNQDVDVQGIEEKVSFAELGGEPVDFTVETSGQNTVIVKPVHDLRFWDDYVVSVDDVSTLDGKKCDAGEIAFATLEPEEAPQPLRPAPIANGAMIGP